MNGISPKFELTIAKPIKPVICKNIDEQMNKPVRRTINEKVLENGNIPAVKDLVQKKTFGPDDERTPTLYCEVSVKHMRFPLIVSSGLAETIISLSFNE